MLLFNKAEGTELLILVTELTINYYGSRFISRYGCKEYFAHNKELLLYERKKKSSQSWKNWKYKCTERR